jgi:hypothetical protein
MSRAASELAHLFRALKAPAAARALPVLTERAREQHPIASDPARVRTRSDKPDPAPSGSLFDRRRWVTIQAAPTLAEGGWLERRVEDNGDTSWWWTPAAETALNLS